MRNVVKNPLKTYTVKLLRTGKILRAEFMSYSEYPIFEGCWKSENRARVSMRHLYGWKTIKDGEFVLLSQAGRSEFAKFKYESPDNYEAGGDFYALNNLEYLQAIACGYVNKERERIV